MSSLASIGRVALAFPGQGSQRVGMGQDLIQQGFRAAKLVFEEVDEALGFRLSKLVSEGPVEDLNRTFNAQPAILANSIAHHRCTMEVAPDLLRGTAVAGALGHSLGEYSALVASGSMPLSDAVQAVHLRGEAMQRAADAYGTDTAMMALLRFDTIKLEEFRIQLSNLEHDMGGVCGVANVNSDQQIVISGSSKCVEAAVELAKASYGVRRATRLPVSAPFHCSIMTPAAQELEVFLTTTAKISKPMFPVISNVTGDLVTDPNEIIPLLVRQVTAPVKWTDCVQSVTRLGATHVIECGSNVLTGLTRQIKSCESEWISISSVEDVAQMRTLQAM